MFQDSEENGSRKLSENCVGLVERRVIEHVIIFSIPDSSRPAPAW